MFDGLQDKLQDVFRQLKGEGKVTPEALDAALRQIAIHARRIGGADSTPT